MSAQSAQTLINNITAAVREANKDQTLAIQQQIHEVTFELMQIKAQLTSIAENQKSGTKSVSRTPKVVDVKEGEAPKADAASATLTAALVSKPAYFKHMYKTSEDFRKEYSNAFIADAIKADASIAKKKTDADKLAAEANAVWNTLRTNATDANPEIKTMFAKYNVAFDDAKKNHAAAQKAAPLTADAAPAEPVTTA